MEKISVIGIGRLGLCFSLTLEKGGYDVIGVDIKQDYVNAINSKTFNSFEPGVTDHLKKVKVQGIEPYQDLVGPRNVFREDKVSISDEETNLSLLKEAPEKNDRFIKTKNPLQ